MREVHPASLKDWKFGGISKGGRGGMEAKVNAALGALEVGVKSVVLASGSEKEVLQRRGRGVFIHIASPRRHRRVSRAGSSPATTSAPTSPTTSRGSLL